MEVAAALTDKAHSVSIIGIESVPFKRALGEKLGKAIMKVNVRNMKTHRGSQRVICTLYLTVTFSTLESHCKPHYITSVTSASISRTTSNIQQQTPLPVAM